MLHHSKRGHAQRHNFIQMKVLQTIAGFGALYGGIATCTYDLIRALHGISFPVDLLTPKVRNPSDHLMGAGEEWIKILDNDAVTPYEYSQNFRQALTDSDYDVYHTNGLWLYANHATCAEARRRGKPYIITPHGMLYPGALHRSYWKKWPLIQLCFRKDINRAACIHVTCSQELEHVRRFGYKGPAAIIPNPANLPDYLEGLALEKPEILRGQKTRLFGFLGRLHPIKQIENLLYALTKLKNEKCKLVIMGKGEEQYEKFLQSETHRLGLDDRVTFCGFVSGREKYERLAQFSCLFVPSDFENFGMIVTEALSVGTPVMASLGTPWEELNTERCGWWTDRSPESIAGVMSEVMTLSEEDLISMGNRGRRLVLAKYTPTEVACKMRRLYEWVVSGGERPEFVDVME